MQKHLGIFLGRKFKKSKINFEFPMIHGTADILMMNKDEWYFFELKENINQKVFEQAIKHKKVADFLFVVTNKPVKKETIDKWKDFDENVNVIWIEELSKKAIKNAFKNKHVDKIIRRKIYEETLFSN